MKTVLLTLGLTFQVALLTAQGTYSYARLEAQLNAKSALMPEQTIEYERVPNISMAENWRIDSLLEMWYSLDKSAQNNQEAYTLFKELKEVTTSIAQVEVDQLNKFISQVELTQSKFVQNNRFDDSLFKASVKQLYYSEKLFEYTFKHAKSIDSMLLRQYQDSVRVLWILREDLKQHLAFYRKDTLKTDFLLKRYQEDKDNLLKIVSSIRKVEQFFDALVEKLNSNRTLLYSEVEKASFEKEQLNEINTVPAVLSGLSEINVVPSINVFAQRIIRKSGEGKIYGANLFLSSEQVAKDSIADESFKSRAVYNILQPEASKFGFRMNYQRLFIVSDNNKTKEKRVELAGSFNYLLKSLSLNSSDSANNLKSTIKSIGLIHVKGGGEWFFSEYFSCNVMLNYVYVVQNSALYQQYFGVNKGQVSLLFFNMGLNANLSFSGQQNNIKVGLDFVLNNAQIRRLNNSDDLLIPSLRFIYIPNLGKSF